MAITTAPIRAKITNFRGKSLEVPKLAGEPLVKCARPYQSSVSHTSVTARKKTMGVWYFNAKHDASFEFHKVEDPKHNLSTGTTT